MASQIDTGRLSKTNNLRGRLSEDLSLSDVGGPSKLVLGSLPGGKNISGLVWHIPQLLMAIDPENPREKAKKAYSCV